MRKKSIIPIYITGGFFVLFCLIFPLYRLWHFVLLFVLAVLVYLGASKLFPGTVEYIEEPEKPVTTGNDEFDALLREGETAVRELIRIKSNIPDTEIRKKIDKLIELTDKIFKDILEDPDDYKMIRRFSSYFLPTTIKLLNAYDRMDSTGIEGENISATKARVAEILDTTILAYEKELDALFANQALDIETDIAVLENLLKMEGLN